MRLSACLLSLFLFVAAWSQSEPSHAWGKQGHLTICDLAYRNLTPASRSNLNEILRGEQGGIRVPARGRTPAQHYTSFNYGCLEEDGMPRPNPSDHFINLPRDMGAITNGSCPTTARRGECILSGIQRDLATLKDNRKSREERAIALFALGHWIGDLHQPLHISFADDRGGNGIDAKVAGGCGIARYRPDDLHAVWDNCLLEAGLIDRVRRRSDYRADWSRFTVTYRAVDTLMANTSTAEEQSIVSGAPWNWAAESFAITLDPATRYCTRTGNTCAYSAEAGTLRRNGTKRLEQIEQDYLKQFAPVAEERIKRAGFRLGHLLNQALDPSYLGPAANGLQRP